MRPRLFIARAGVLVVVVLVVWLLALARHDADRARRGQVEQARRDAAANAVLLDQLQAAQHDRDAQAADLQAAREQLAGLRVSVRELPGRIPRSTTTTTRTITLPPALGRGPRGPAGPPGPRGTGTPSAAASRPGPVGPVPSPAPPPRACVAVVAGLGVCRAR